MNVSHSTPTVPSKQKRPFFRGRFPSRREFGKLLIGTTTPLHFWAVLQFLYRVPAFILRLSVKDILALLAYVLSAALVETLLVGSAITLLAALLPRGALRNPFMPTTIAVVYTSMLGTLAFQYLAVIAEGVATVLPIHNYLLLYLATLGCILFSYIAVVLRIPHIMRARPALQRAVEALIERLSVLSGLFLAADILSLAVVFWRNLF